jgi:chorismate mutase
MTTSTLTTVAAGRARIDAIDAQLLALIAERTEVSRAIQRARQAEGGPRVALAREGEVVGRWRGALDRPGTTIAMALLELGRGRL